MASLELHHVFKVYPNGVKAVNDFVLDAPDKEFIVFVGPSGCGKSTTLRMIAGLEEITAGDIKIDGQIVNDEEPKERDIAMVFQNYALYPHMTVYKNMAFGLKLRHVPKAEVDRRVKEAAEILGLTEYLNRKPKEMSGGQRQRVALGRAIVREPKLFLLDEPLSNLDAKLRASMRSEIAKLHKKVGTTFVYVTHDQVEAMTLGTKVVVMKEGFVKQIDSPINLYKHPANKFVAGFIGTPQMNFFNGTLEKVNDEVLMKINGTELEFKLPFTYFAKADSKYLDGKKELTFGIRSEHISVNSNNLSHSCKVKVNFMEELGVDSQVYASFDLKNDQIISDDKEQLIIKCPNTTHFETNQIIDIYFDFNQLHVFDAQTEETIIPRIPSEITTNAEVKENNISIYGTKVTLPEAIKCKNGMYNVSIPVSSISMGNTVKAKVINVEVINNLKLLILKTNDEYLHLLTDMNNETKVGEEIKVDIDFKKCKLVNDSNTIEPLKTSAMFTAGIKKIPTKVEHFNKDNNSYFKKEFYCAVDIDGISYGTCESLGKKLLNLKEKRIFRGPINLEVGCYDMKLSDNGLPGKIVRILDYGKEKFAEVEVVNLENKQTVIVSCDDSAKLGDTCIQFNIDKCKFYNKKNNVRLA